MPEVVAVDVGNVNIKHRSQGASWVASPSVVRNVTSGGYSFAGRQAQPRALRYQRGPAGINPQAAVYVGADALKAGAGDLAIIGNAATRMASDAYVWQHLFGILSSLPSNIRQAEVLFAGGLPARDAADPTIGQVLKRRLVGAHQLTWGDTSYDITIAGCLFAPQPVAALATFIYDSSGRVLTNGAAANVLRKRWILDIGGGTTDWTMRAGLDLVPGTEGGADIGMNTAAHRALHYVKQNHGTAARGVQPAQVLEALRSESDHVFIGGARVEIKDEIEAGLADVAQQVLSAAITPDTRRELAGAEAIVIGGGGRRLAKPIAKILAGEVGRIENPTNALTIIGEGLERMGLNAASKGAARRK